MSPAAPDSEWDAVVIGAGPAGALAAMRLARRGARVLVVEKGVFPRPKVCGGCLGAVGLGALRSSGVDLPTIGVRSTLLSEVVIHSGGRKAKLPLGERRGVDRAELDAALVDEAARAGAVVAFDTAARIGPALDGWRAVRLRDADRGERSVRARLVVVAAGLGGHRLLPAEERPAALLSGSGRVGVGATLTGSIGLPATISMFCGAAGYAGVAPLPGGRLDVAAALEPRVLADGLADAGRVVAELLAAAGCRLPGEGSGATWRATPRLGQRPSRLGAERVLLIGDASGYVEPFTGEGIGWALASAVRAEPIALAGIEAWDDRLVDRWEGVYRAGIGAAQRRCGWLCGLVGARRVTPWVVGALSLAPWLGKPIAKRIDPASVRFTPTREHAVE